MKPKTFPTVSSFFGVEKATHNTTGGVISENEKYTATLTNVVASHPLARV